MPRVAIVTGGTRGIGAAISIGLKDAGYTVAASYAGNDEAANKFKGDTGIAVYKWDVGDFGACAAGIAKVEADLGPVEILVNNAGITRDGLLHKMSAENWHTVIRTNLDSVFNMTQPLINGMRERGFGRIITISSINGQKGQMGQTNYSAAKAGVIGFTKALAQEGARKGITANVVAPGYIGTEMVMAIPEQIRNEIVSEIPVGRLGEPWEICLPEGNEYLWISPVGFITTGNCINFPVTTELLTGTHTVRVRLPGGCEFYDYLYLYGKHCGDDTPPQPGGIITARIGNGVRAWPNPAQGLLKVEMGFSGPKTLQLFRADGRRLMHRETEDAYLEISTGPFPAGAYWLDVSAGGGHERLKIIILK